MSRVSKLIGLVVGLGVFGGLVANELSLKDQRIRLVTGAAGAGCLSVVFSSLAQAAAESIEQRREIDRRMKASLEAEANRRREFEELEEEVEETNFEDDRPVGHIRPVEWSERQGSFVPGGTPDVCRGCQYLGDLSKDPGLAYLPHPCAVNPSGPWNKTYCADFVAKRIEWHFVQVRGGPSGGLYLWREEVLSDGSKQIWQTPLDLRWFEKSQIMALYGVKNLNSLIGKRFESQYSITSRARAELSERLKATPLNMEFSREEAE